MLEVLDADALRRWCEAAVQALEQARDEIDRLNVYPVPDGDTGTNLVLTMQAVRDAVHGADGDLPSTVKAMARGALMGARGNSGVIVSQVLRGLAEVFAAGPAAGPEQVRTALDRAADLAYAAVAQPVEGTVLTVARAAADAVRSAPDDLAVVVRTAAQAADEALARTPEQLEALARAGVVDAGGRGLVVLLDALVEVVTGAVPPDGRIRGPVARVSRPQTTVRETGSSDYAYEVQYLLSADAAAVPALEARLAQLGDSLAVVGADGTWNVHVHVNDVGAAIEAGVEAGRPHRISVTRFADQAPPAAAPARGRGIVAVAPGVGLSRLLGGEGATVVDGGPTSNPSTADLLSAVRETGAREVVVFPNDGNVQGVAEAAAALARDDGLNVAVVPTRSPVQCLAALAVHHADAEFAADVATMSAAAGATRWGEVTVAVRDAQTDAGWCRRGDALGLLDGEVVVVGADLGSVAAALVDRMLLGGGELVTLVTGQGAGQRFVAGLTEHLRRGHSAVQTAVYDGGQPHYPLLVGVE